MSSPRVAFVLGCAVASSFTSACGDAVTTDEPPLVLPRAEPEFEVVSEMLGVRCGSLDCHGQTARPLRVHHRQGMRLSPDDVPGEGDTTPAEHAANLRAIVGLEPELTAAVLREGGRAPERLSIFRKAIGLERHKGGQALAIDDVQDRCLRSWLEGRTDVDRCERAARLERP